MASFQEMGKVNIKGIESKESTQNTKGKRSEYKPSGTYFPNFITC